jgi:hypothetical protein
MSAKNKRNTGIKAKVLKAIRSGYCNTVQDVADEVQITNRVASAYISVFKKAGYVRHNGMSMPNVFGRGCRLQVFEVLNA